MDVENKIYLLPGDLCVTNSGQIVWTVLGSCVSVIFHNKRTHTSAVCHAQLPHEHGNESCKASCPKPCGREEKKDYKYVTCALKFMKGEFDTLKIQSNEIEVSLYGGAGMTEGSNVFNIGKKNIAMAKEVLKGYNLTIAYTDIGGGASRSFTHNSFTGETFVKK